MPQPASSALIRIASSSTPSGRHLWENSSIGGPDGGHHASTTPRCAEQDQRSEPIGPNTWSWSGSKAGAYRPRNARCAAESKTSGFWYPAVTAGTIAGSTAHFTEVLRRQAVGVASSSTTVPGIRGNKGGGDGGTC